VGGNFSKLKKENNLKIFHIMARGKLVNKTLNFSIQNPKTPKPQNPVSTNDKFKIRLSALSLMAVLVEHNKV
jgi:hypothetical protein